MTTAAAPLLQLIEQRTALLAALAETFAAARLDVVRFDVSSLERRISEQDRLCSQIRSVDSTLDQMQRRCSAYLAAEQRDNSLTVKQDNQKLRDALQRLQSIQETVKGLNDAHQLLLRRSRRTVSALLQSYQSLAQDAAPVTYSDPACAAVSSRGVSAQNVSTGERI